MMYGAAASIHITQSILRVVLQEASLLFSRTVVAASALALTLQAQYESLLIFLVSILYDAAPDAGQKWA